MLIIIIDLLTDLNDFRIIGITALSIVNFIHSQNSASHLFLRSQSCRLVLNDIVPLPNH